MLAIEGKLWLDQQRLIYMAPTGHTVHWAVAPNEPPFHWEKSRWSMTGVLQDKQALFSRVQVTGRKG